jgi:hypothetical protein
MHIARIYSITDSAQLHEEKKKEEKNLNTASFQRILRNKENTKHMQTTYL